MKSRFRRIDWTVGCIFLFLLAAAIAGRVEWSEDTPAPPFAMEPRKEQVLRGFTSPMAFSPDGNSLLAEKYRDDWSPTTVFQLVPRGDASPPKVRWVGNRRACLRAWSLDGRFMVHGGWPMQKERAPCQEILRLVDSVTGETVQELSGHTQSIAKVVFAPNGKWLASASEDGTVRLWEIASGKGLGIFSGHEGWVSDLAFSPDSRQLACIDHRFVIRVWDTATGNLVRSIDQDTAHNASGCALVAFHPNGRLLATSNIARTGKDGWVPMINIWDLHSSIRTIKVCSVPYDAFGSLAFYKEGRYLISASDKIDFWEIRTKQLAYRLDCGPGIRDFIVSPDGRRLAVSTDTLTDEGVAGEPYITIWDLAPGNQSGGRDT